MTGQCWANVYNAGPILNQHWLHRLQQSQHTAGVNPVVDQCWANIYNAGPTLNQHWLHIVDKKIGHRTTYTKPMVDQCWASIADGGPLLVGRHYANIGPTSRVPVLAR